MIYKGDNLHVDFIEPGIAEITFDAPGSVNKFDEKTLTEFSEALDLSLIHISEPTRLGMISYAVFY